MQTSIWGFDDLSYSQQDAVRQPKRSTHLNQNPPSTQTTPNLPMPLRRTLAPLLNDPPRRPTGKKGRLMAAPSFDAETVRAIRLSPLSNGQAAIQWGVSIGAIQKARVGHRYGPLLPDEEAAHKRRIGRVDFTPLTMPEYLLGVGRLFGGGVLPDQDRQEAMDAVYECSGCGRLPHEGCGCLRIAA